LSRDTGRLYLAIRCISGTEEGEEGKKGGEGGEGGDERGEEISANREENRH
jgi:hypothetical protein